MKKQPLVSFCITTYKRPDFLKSTIEAILRQKYSNLEIVISEDPSENTSEKVVKSFKSKNIIYHKNKTRLGMVKSFNKALFLCKGDFVNILTDDDPPTDDFLETFVKVLKKYPDMKILVGGSYANITTKKIEQVTSLKMGLNSLINKNKPYGYIEKMPSKLFIENFLTGELFPHYQWNSGLTARSILRKIGGVPDYNSAHLIDYALLIKIASLSDVVVINKELSIFALHELSYGKKQDTLSEYKRGVIGFHKSSFSLIKKLGLEKSYQEFLSKYITIFLVNRLQHYKIHKYEVSPKNLFKVYADLSNFLPFLKKHKPELYLKLNYYQLYQKLNSARKVYGDVKLKLIGITQATT